MDTSCPCFLFAKYAYLIRGIPFFVHLQKEYIMAIHGFEEDNITVLMDDGEHESPNRDNILAAYRKLVADSEPGDAIFCHYSGHGAKIKDDDFGEEEDGYDETLVPVDYNSAGMVRDDDIYDILVKPLPDGVHMVCLFDCCHSGTVMDLPYIFKADGTGGEMEIDEQFDFKKLLGKFGTVMGKLEDFLQG
jgi:hypothetical protein